MRCDSLKIRSFVDEREDHDRKQQFQRDGDHVVHAFATDDAAMSRESAQSQHDCE